MSNLARWAADPLPALAAVGAIGVTGVLLGWAPLTLAGLAAVTAALALSGST